MWTRSELKARAKAAFKRNYWKCVLVALILTLLLGSGASSSVRKNQNQDASADQHQAVDMLSGYGDSSLVQSVVEAMEKLTPSQRTGVTIALGGIGLVGIALSILVFNPLIVGCRRFFLQNSRGGAELSELGAGFKNNWGNVILVMFLRNLFLALWALLLVFPAIIKGYSYRMVPYLLTEHPELSGTQVITVSRQMMNGHKWRAFVLDLSFLGWILLSIVTVGILGVFYVSPYVAATDAELYKAIRAEYEARASV